MLQHKDRCTDFIVDEVFDKKVVVLFMIALIVVYILSFPPSICLYTFMYISSVPVLSSSFIMLIFLNLSSSAHPSTLYPFLSPL